MPHELEGLERQLNEIVGGEYLLGGAAAAGFAVDGVVPTLVARPGTQEQVEAAVAACGKAGAAIAPWGGGTAMGLGNAPARLDVVLCLGRLSRIVEFDAANLVVSAEAGVRMADLQQLLATKREVLPLDCACMDRRTVGGVIATNASGPSRLLYGTARDLVLGLRVVLGNGERVRCGGKVIKNVSGYDMNKVFIGSLGTLGIITEATFKLLPMPATRATVTGVFGDLAQAAAVVKRVLESFLLPEAMELLDPQALATVAASLGLAGGSAGYGVAVSLAGSPETVERQVRDFTQLFTDGKAVRTSALGADASPAAWRELRGALDRVGGANDRVAVKIAVPISRTSGFVAKAEELGRRQGWRGAIAAHAGSGVVRAVYAIGAGAPEPVRDAIEALRREAERAEGSLVVEAAPAALKRHLEAWGKPGEALSVMRRMKTEYDPRGFLNPGRFLGGI
jgi:glycolate oxidase FAD binding subunit